MYSEFAKTVGGFTVDSAVKAKLEALELPEDFSTLSNDEATELLGLIVEIGREVVASDNSQEKLDALKSLKDAKLAVEARIGELTAEATALAAETEEFASAFADEDADEDSDEDADEADADESDEDDADEADDADDSDDDDDDSGEAAEKTAAGKVEVPKHRAPRSKKTAGSITAPVKSSDGHLLSVEELGERLKGAQGYRVPQGSSQYHNTFARVEMFPGVDEVVRSGMSGLDATSLINDLIGRNKVKTAAGGFCGPGDTIKTVRECGTDSRPIAALFPQIPIEGEFRYVRQPALTDVLAGATIWTNADDQAVESDDVDTWKPCVAMDCSLDIQATPYAVTFCGTFGEFQQFSNPSLVNAFLNLGGVAYARTAEAALLERINDQSIQLTYDASTELAGYGALSALIDAVSSIIGNATYNGRLDPSSYTLILPPALVQLLQADETFRAFGDGVSDSQVIAWVAAKLGVRVVQALDVRTSSTNFPPALPAAGGPPVALTPLDTDYDVYLVPTSDFVLGQRTLVDLGIQRSPDLVRQNKAQYFVESVEALEKLGCNPSYALDLDNLCANGGRAGFATPRDCGLGD